VVWLRAKGIPVLYTLHDPDPHVGTPLRGLVKLYTYWTARLADRVFIYGEVYRQRLTAAGFHPDRLVVLPLLHLFLGYQAEQALWQVLDQPGWITYEPAVLFFGRLLPYKGVDVLLEAFHLWRPARVQLVIAGHGNLNSFGNDRPWPEAIRVYDRHITDDLAVALFRTCSLVVLPYRDATQSALVAAAYVFRKPVLVTRTGAMTEYVRPNETGFIVPPEDPQALAAALADAFAQPARLPLMGEAGRQWYQARRREEYDRLLTAYRSVLPGRSQTTPGNDPTP
jgi:glycosyltransferase involved in cell wall biosynthesis